MYNFVVVRIIKEDITHASVKAKSETETERKNKRKRQKDETNARKSSLVPFSASASRSVETCWNVSR